MKIEDILKYLSDRNIQATEAQVKSLGVDLDDITPQSIEVIAQQLQSQSTAIAPQPHLPPFLLPSAIAAKKTL
jgi:hypothetical protein